MGARCFRMVAKVASKNEDVAFAELSLRAHRYYLTYLSNSYADEPVMGASCPFIFLSAYPLLAEDYEIDDVRTYG